MNKKEQLNQYFDGELSAQESSMIKGAMELDPELAKHSSKLKEMAELHLESIPEAKNDFFIEQEFLEIQNQLNAESEQPKKLLPFPGHWMIQAVGIAAAMVITVTGVWMWNQNKLVDSNFQLNTAIAFVETDIDGASSMIYMDEQSGWTYVWVEESEIGSTEELAG